MKKLVVLISNTGTGTNLQAIIDGIENKTINAKIISVISDTENSKGLDRARKHNLPYEIVPRKDMLLSVLQKNNPDYICLCGWKQIILDDVIDAFPNKILNLHPGIIPDSLNDAPKSPDGTQGLWNKGKLTDKAIQNVLDSKSSYAGSSIHFLTHNFDFGPVLGRCYEKVEPGDTIDSLYSRLKKRENQLYEDVLMNLCK